MSYFLVYQFHSNFCQWIIFVKHIFVAMHCCAFHVCKFEFLILFCNVLNTASEANKRGWTVLLLQIHWCAYA